MANISITRRCRRHCRYCFAKHELSLKQTADMPLETYEAALEFLERSGFPEARLLGGEPTEHPRFCEYLTLALQRGFRVVIFSGGLIPSPVLEHLAVLPADNLSIVLNAANPAKDPDFLVDRQREVCQALGAKVMLGVNIQSLNDDPSYLLDWVNEYDLFRTVRVGIAQPIWGGGNDFFRLRGHRIIPVFERLVANGTARGVNVGFDCGFTPCMFSEEFVDAHADMFVYGVGGAGASLDQIHNAEQGKDVTNSNSNIPNQPAANPGSFVEQRHTTPSRQIEVIGVRCGPVIDILPEGNCIACYALSRFRRIPLPSTGCRNDLVSFFDDQLSSVLPSGAHRACTQCGYRMKGICNGGCRARRAWRLRPNAFVTLDH